MGLTIRQPGAITKNERYLYEIRDENGERFRHCGSERDRDLILDLYPTYTAHRFSLPLPPSVVNVTAVELEREKALPESQAVPLNL